MFALQVVKYGKIADYAEANFLLQKIMGFESNVWIGIKKEFKPVLKELTDRLNNVVTFHEFYTFFEIDADAKIHIKPLFTLPNIVKFRGLKTGEFVERYGLWYIVCWPWEVIGNREFCKTFKIKVTAHSENNSILHFTTMVRKFPRNFSYFQMDSPSNEITSECSQGIVVNINTGEILCFPCSPIIQDFKKLKNFPENFSVFETIDGLFVTLYYYNNQWQIASKCRN
jgi:hypothetical protein